MGHKQNLAVRASEFQDPSELTTVEGTVMAKSRKMQADGSNCCSLWNGSRKRTAPDQSIQAGPCENDELAVAEKSVLTGFSKPQTLRSSDQSLTGFQAEDCYALHLFFFGLRHTPKA